jgi:hypothetical protein
MHLERSGNIGRVRPVWVLLGTLLKGMKLLALKRPGGIALPNAITSRSLYR